MGFTDVDVVGVGDLDGYKHGTFPQTGCKLKTLKLDVEPEFRYKSTNYQGVCDGFVVGPDMGKMSCKGELLYDTPAGIGLVDSITPFVPDFSTAITGLSAGSWYALKRGFDFESQKLCDFDAEFELHKLVA